MQPRPGGAIWTWLRKRVLSLGMVYGAAGSLVVPLLWVYYSGLVFFFGAEITEAYAHETQRPIVPDETAERVPGRR